MNLIDLHVHSNASDGTFSPRELAFYAKAKGLSTIALTDHDTIDGVEACMEAAKLVDLDVIPGIEFSGTYNKVEVHILGFYIDPTHPLLTTTLKKLVEDRNSRNDKMITKLTELDCPITKEDLFPPGVTDGVLTRAHFAKALLKRGFVSSMDEAFDKYLGNNCPAYIPRETMSYQECINLIHEVGGVAVIAHPYLYKLKTTPLEQLIGDMVEAGIDGIECIYPKYSKEQVDTLISFCQKHHLLITGGSDFHGSNKPGLDIARGYNDIEVPTSLLSPLKERLAK